MADYESNKDLYILDSAVKKRTAASQVLDPSLPWWTERDKWGRWANPFRDPNEAAAWEKAEESPLFRIASSNRHIRDVEKVSAVTLSQILQSLSSDPRKQVGHQSRIVCR